MVLFIPAFCPYLLTICLMYLIESFLPFRVEKKKLLSGLLFLQLSNKSVKYSGMARSRSLLPLPLSTLSLPFVKLILPGLKLTTSETLSPQLSINDSIALFLSPVGYLLLGCFNKFWASSSSKVMGSFFLVIFGLF